MKNNPVTRAQIEQFIPSLVRHYAEKKVLSEYELVALSNFFDAFLSGDLMLLAALFKVYEKVPEDCLLIMAAFTKVFGGITNDRSSYYSYAEGDRLLHIHARTIDPERRPHVRSTGEETHALNLYLDGRAPTGYKHCLDDHLWSAGAGNRHSGAVAAADALQQLVRVVEEGIAYRIADGSGNRFDTFDLSESSVSQHRKTSQFVKGKRALEVELAQAKSSRNALSYLCWRWGNRAKLKCFSL